MRGSYSAASRGFPRTVMHSSLTLIGKKVGQKQTFYSAFCEIGKALLLLQDFDFSLYFWM